MAHVDGRWWGPRERTGSRVLTPREHEAWTHWADGLSSADIGRRMGISPARVGQLLARAAQVCRAYQGPGGADRPWLPPRTLPPCDATHHSS
jgi:hypothetical protein